MIITINNTDYKVRHNYLHRGINPRLVLEHKEDGGLVWVQFDSTATVQGNINYYKFLISLGEMNDAEQTKAVTYKGYWVTLKNPLTPITITIKEF